MGADEKRIGSACERYFNSTASKEIIEGLIGKWFKIRRAFRDETVTVGEIEKIEPLDDKRFIVHVVINSAGMKDQYVVHVDYHSLCFNIFGDVVSRMWGSTFPEIAIRKEHGEIEITGIVPG